MKTPSTCKRSLSLIAALFLFVLQVFASGCSEPEKMLKVESEADTVDTAELETSIQQIMDDYIAVNLQVAVVKGDDIIYTHSFGYKDLEAQIPLSDTDIFRIASISKSFAATAIMQLIEAGDLSLDDDVSDLMGFQIRNPNFPDTPITLKMLLTHTSSISDAAGYRSLDVINPEENANWADSYNDYAPGTDYEYANLNYNTVGAIIEQVTGQRFDLYIKEHIMDPLGLYGGHCPDLLNADLFAQIYRDDPETGEHIKSLSSYKLLGDKLDTYRIGYDAPMLSPTGNMKISATDLAKYMIMHKNLGIYNGVRIISEQSAQQMQTPQTEIRTDSYYGFALGIYDNFAPIPGKQIIGHAGSMYGMRSGMYFNHEDDFGIILIASGAERDYLNLNGFRGKVINALYEHFNL